MCFYITATLPKKTDLDKIRTILDEFEMSFIPIHNDRVLSQLKADNLYLRAIKSYCDCNTILGSLNRQIEHQTLLNSKKVKTLRKKKWTDKEIDNWIKQKLQNKQKEFGRNLTTFERIKELKRWNLFLQMILNSLAASRIGILKHWYKGGLDDEKITLKEIQRINLNEVAPEFLLNIEEDVLYEFYIPFWKLLK
jgi:hypothetical protein